MTQADHKTDKTVPEGGNILSNNESCVFRCKVYQRSGGKSWL
jgi:hypothetical protein